MCKKYCLKVKNYLLNPKKAFEKEVGTSLGDAIKYLLGMSIILAVLNCIYISYTMSFIANFAIFLHPFILFIILLLISSYIFTVVFNLLGGLWLHLFAYIFSARKGLRQTLKVVIYGSTPGYFLGWIPFVNIVSMIWSLVLEYFGLVRLQKMKSGHAIAAIAFTILIPIAIFLIFMIVFIPAMFQLSGMSALTILGVDFY